MHFLVTQRVAARYASRALQLPFRPLSTIASQLNTIRADANCQSNVINTKKCIGSSRSFNFATNQYASCFSEIPTPNVDKLRKDAVAYLDSFDRQSWYDDPVCSILRGEKLLATPSNLWITKDSLSQPNGHQYFATPSQIQDLMQHIQNFKSPSKDMRSEVRRIEQKFLNEYAGFLIGNQCLDFAKQDGITEIEESIMANSVERKLNDILLLEEQNGKVAIVRKPIFVSCVSNFTNFLDLFRKTLRSMELGIPCVVLGRSHTIQHSYRWTELLVELMKEEGIDAGMLTYLSCQLDDIKFITASCQEQAGMLYTTCSRQLAKAIKKNYPNTIASTGGPNTLLTTEWTKPVQDAIRMSASIECAGQCTALRHAVVPNSVKLEDIEATFNDMTHVASPVEALRQKAFDGVFPKHGGTPPPSFTDKDGPYSKHCDKDAYFKMNETLPSPESGELEEYWRKVVVDVTTSAPATSATTPFSSHSDKQNKLMALSKWLIHHQPISLAINAPRSQVFDLGRTLFEQTSLVVNTIGSTDKADAPPAMTCQARPQDAECFGEFPPRKSLDVYTKYPVIIPSSTPSYDTHYRRQYLESVSSENLGVDKCQSWLMEISDKAIQGYCVELLRYLIDATEENPKRGFGSGRTALWGIQRPPMLDGYRTVIRCGPNVTFDDVSPMFFLFHFTNACLQMELSVDGSNKKLLEIISKHDLDTKLEVEDDDEFKNRVHMDCDDIYNVVEVPSLNGGADDDQEVLYRLPMPGQFVSLYLPMGHIKSTMKNDEEFVKYFGESQKWLKMA